MKRCPRLHCGGQVLVDDGRAVCLLCGHVAYEPEPGLLEKMWSNATPQQDQLHETFEPRQTPDVTGIAARVMARIRAEASR